MSYQPLARKYRPSKFSDLVGQEAATKALSNAVALGREPHAVIFSGVRGIGKTTTARLYAKALNCESGPTPTPCGKCVSCEAIAGGYHEDVIEIDGASNNGVDEIRSLRESVQYVPQRSNFKIYIIDEVHMLSTSAFNALLKTLEEPPGHVVFVMATTELHKIPQTVVGRCQTFYLQKISIATATSRIETILNEEGIEYEKDCLDLIAKEGKGSMRDSLTFLDQVIALGGGVVSRQAIEEIVPSVSILPMVNIIKAMLERQALKAIDTVLELETHGLKPDEVVQLLITACRHCFIHKSLPEDHLSLRTVRSEEKVYLSELAEIANPVELNQIFRVFVECSRELDGSNIDRFILENTIIEWCADPGIPVVEDFVQFFSHSGFTNTQHPGPQSRAGAISTSNANQVSSVPVTQETPSGSAKKISKGFKEQLDSLRKKKTPQLTKKAPEAPPNPEPIQSKVTSPAQVIKQVESEVTELHFPNSWENLVETWKKSNPIEGRKLEELRVTSYSNQHIEIFVDPNRGMAAALLEPERTQAFRSTLSRKFGFKGQISVKPLLAEVGSVESVPESLLEVKEKRKQQEHKEIVESVKSSPITQALIEQFDGTISNISVF